MLLSARTFTLLLLLTALALPAAAQQNFRASIAIPASDSDQLDATPRDLLVTIEHLSGQGTGATDWLLGISAEGGDVIAGTLIGTDAIDFLAIPPFSVVRFGFPINKPGIAIDVSLDTIANTSLPSESTSSVARITVVPDGFDPSGPNIADPSQPLILTFDDSIILIEESFPNPFFLRVVHLFRSLLNSEVPALGGFRRRPGNLVPNGEFDDDADGWTTDDPSAVVGASIVDVDNFGDRHSGSLTAPSMPAGTSRLVSSCVRAFGGFTYMAGGSIFQLSATAFASSGIDVIWYDDLGCTSPIGSTARVDATETAIWQSFDLTPTAPTGTRAAQVRCVLESTGTIGGTVVTLCDSMYLPEPGSSTAAAAALGCLVLLALSARAPGRGRAQLE